MEINKLLKIGHRVPAIALLEKRKIYPQSYLMELLMIMYLLPRFLSIQI